MISQQRDHSGLKENFQTLLHIWLFLLKLLLISVTVINGLKAPAKLLQWKLRVIFSSLCPLCAWHVLHGQHLGNGNRNPPILSARKSAPKMSMFRSWISKVKLKPKSLFRHPSPDLVQIGTTHRWKGSNPLYGHGRQQSSFYRKSC